MRRTHLRAAAAAVMALSLLAACGTNGDSTGSDTGNGGKSETTVSDQFDLARGPEIGKPGPATPPKWEGEGVLPANQPDTNGDGEVFIGALTSGDIKDKTYYQSINDAVESVAKRHGWKYNVQGSVTSNQAEAAVESLCRQGADIVVIGNGEVSPGLNARHKPACEGVFFYLQVGFGGPEMDQTFVESFDPALTYSYVAGVAAGSYMKANDIDKVGFIAGIPAPFNTTPASLFEDGVLSVLPDASVLKTFTGDQIDVGKAVEAFKAQKGQGIGLVYPYFGAPTVGVAKKANEENFPVMASPIDFCSADEIDVISSVMFAPGYLHVNLLEEFAEGKLELGRKRNWRIGIDPIPTVKACDGAGDAKDAMTESIQQAIDDINNGVVDPVALAEKASK